MIYIEFLHKDDLDDQMIEEFEEDIREDWRKDMVDSDRCPVCHKILRETYETDDAYGAPMRIYFEYCEWCGYERR